MAKQKLHKCRCLTVKLWGLAIAATNALMQNWPEPDQDGQITSGKKGAHNNK